MKPNDERPAPLSPAVLAAIQEIARPEAPGDLRERVAGRLARTGAAPSKAWRPWPVLATAAGIGAVLALAILLAPGKPPAPEPPREAAVAPGAVRVGPAPEPLPEVLLTRADALAVRPRPKAPRETPRPAVTYEDGVPGPPPVEAPELLAMEHIAIALLDLPEMVVQPLPALPPLTPSEEPQP